MQTLSRWKADLALLTTSIVWGSAFVAQRMIGEQGSVYLFNGARLFVGGALLWAMMGFRPLRGEKGFWRWVVIAGALLFAGSALQQMGLKYTTAGNAGFLTSLYTALTPFLLFLFWRERPSVWTAVAVVLAVVGAYLLSSGGAFQARFGDVLEVIGALFWAGHVTVLGKFASRYPPLRFSAAQFFVAGALSLILGGWTEFPVTFAWGLFWKTVLYTGIFSVAVGYTLQVWGQRSTPPTEASLILSLESVFAALGGWLILGEKLSALQGAGCALIFAAVLLSQVKTGGREVI